MANLNISSKITWPVVTKFHVHVESPRAKGMKICSNSPDHMTSCHHVICYKPLEIFNSRTNELMALKFSI